MSDQTTASVVEIVTFKLAETASDAAFIAQMTRSNSYISTMPGFVDRKLIKAEDGTWTDLVTWRDMASAQAATDGFMAQEFAKDLVGMIDPETMSMSHQPIVWQPETSAA